MSHTHSQQHPQSTNQQSTNQRPTMAQTVAALHAVRDAARSGDHGRYLAALASARAERCIEDQIDDAYNWGVRQRMTVDGHLTGIIDFDSQGNSHHPALTATPATASATTATTSPADDLAAEVTHYAGQGDGATVVEIDAPTGQRVRIYVNDGLAADLTVPE